MDHSTGFADLTLEGSMKHHHSLELMDKLNDASEILRPFETQGLTISLKGQPWMKGLLSQPIVQ